jgi:flagellar biosynthesis protein FlhG
MDAKHTRIIAVSSGKGGVGKTFLSLQLAASLASRGKQVVLFDGDLGLANVHVLLGLKPEFDMSDVVAGRKTLRDILLEGPRGLRIVPGASGQRDIAELDAPAIAGVLRGFDDVDPVPDYLIIDTGAGIGTQVITLARLADLILVVAQDEPASLADAYGLIKVMHLDFAYQKFEVVINGGNNPKRSEAIFNRLDDVTRKFMGLPLVFAGAIPHDETVQQAARQRKLLMDVSEMCPAMVAIRQISARIEAMPPQTESWDFLIDRLKLGKVAPT